MNVFTEHVIPVMAAKSAYQNYQRILFTLTTALQQITLKLVKYSLCCFGIMIHKYMIHTNNKRYMY